MTSVHRVYTLRCIMPPLRGYAVPRCHPYRATPCQDAAHAGEGGKDVSYLHLFIVSVSYYCCSAKLLIPCEIRNRSALFSAFFTTSLEQNSTMGDYMIQQTAMKPRRGDII